MIIIDTSIFLHANYHVLKLYNDDPDEVDIYEKATNQIESILAKNFSGQNYVLALDGNTNFRVGMMSKKYKSSRCKKPKFDKDTMNMLLAENYPTVQIDNLEADDILFLLALLNDDSVIVSTDSDVKLMLGGNTTMYHYRLDEFINLTEEELLVQQLLKVCGGDTTDDVSSIKRSKFGKVFLQKFIDERKKTKKSLLIKDLLHSLLSIDLISPYGLNYDLVVYDLETYDKYFENFEEILEQLCQE